MTSPQEGEGVCKKVTCGDREREGVLHQGDVTVILCIFETFSVFWL